ncbi:hypothetical protein B5P43_35260 [Bacillus sp. SRB_336]|nr:hypothetical protein B5P43_35260 [Bacillus sp. SRB_336]
MPSPPPHQDYDGRYRTALRVLRHRRSREIPMKSSRRNARGEASLERILEATVQLVGRYGYDNTTIARIVKATQRPASSIYWYFENKDQLIAAALENSYSQVVPSRRPWSQFEPARPLLDQLLDELTPELRASESEAPLRQGIMLALEGSAAASQVQEPFQRRRAGAQRRIVAWWATAFAAENNADAAEDATGIEWMGLLTLAFLDGHYISDVEVDDRDAAHRSKIVANALEGAFNALTGGEQSIPLVTSEGPGRSAEADADATDLLHVTRMLVAEHGYEGATMSRICAASGMQRSSIYWRYKDKDSLVKAAVADPFLALLKPLGSLSTSAEQWLEQLSGALRTLMCRVTEQPETVKAGLLLKIQRWDPPTAAGSAVVAGAHEVELRLAAWLDEVLPAPEGAESIGGHLAWTVARFGEGLMLASALGRTVAADSVATMLVPMLSNALKQWPSGGMVGAPTVIGLSKH